MSYSTLITETESQKQPETVLPLKRSKRLNVHMGGPSGGMSLNRTPVFKKTALLVYSLIVSLQKTSMFCKEPQVWLMFHLYVFLWFSKEWQHSNSIYTSPKIVISGKNPVSCCTKGGKCICLVNLQLIFIIEWIIALRSLLMEDYITLIVLISWFNLKRTVQQFSLLKMCNGSLYI